MNVETVQSNSQIAQSQTGTAQTKTDTKFSDELKNLSAEAKTPEEKPDEKNIESDKQQENENKNFSIKLEENSKPENFNIKDNENTISAIDGLEGVFEEISKLNRTDEKFTDSVKKNEFSDDIKNKNEELGLIDNNMNIQEPKDRLQADMNTNMNFNSNGQPFSEFVNPKVEKQTLSTNAKDIAEEKSILSTMEENIAIANKNIALKDVQKAKTVTNEQGTKKVDKETNITIDTIVTFDNVIMDRADVEFFSKIANGEIPDMKEIKNPEKSASVSKTLADLLVKSMENNKPIRIDFDNNISVIIKISREGKISADFLPSSQVAEAYLKENLPLLRQRFDDNNIEYEELNQRKQNQNNNNQNRKKGGKDE